MTNATGNSHPVWRVSQRRDWPPGAASPRRERVLNALPAPYFALILALVYLNISQVGPAPTAQTWTYAAFGVFLIFAGAPLLWLRLRQGSWLQAWQALLPGTPRDAIKGVAIGLAITALVWLTGVIATQFGVQTRTVTAVGPISWTTVIVVAALTAFAEEVFFRGILTRIMPLWATGVAFFAFHYPYATLLQAGIIAGLATAWTVLASRYRLLVLIAAHAVYNGVQLAAFKALA